MTVRPRGLQAAAQYSSMQLSVHSGHMYDDSSFKKKILSCMINVDVIMIPTQCTSEKIATSTEGSDFSAMLFLHLGRGPTKYLPCVYFNNGRCEMTNGVASNAPTRVDRARHLAQMQQYESLEMQPMCLSPSKRDATRVS